MPKKSTAVLQKAFELLSRRLWSEAVVEIDGLLESGVLRGAVSRGGALAMKAEAIEKLGDPVGAARILREAVDQDRAASLQFADLVIRRDLSQYYGPAETSLGLLLSNPGKDNFSRKLAESLKPLHAELRRRLEMSVPRKGPSNVN